MHERVYTAPDAHKWLALCACSETNLPHEFLPIMWVVRNRVAYQSRWPSDYFGVVTQAKQFSYFNDIPSNLKKNKNEYFEAAFTGNLPNGGKIRGLSGQYHIAVEAAKFVLASPGYLAPFGPDVVFFYSPVSMAEVGQRPWWWDEEVDYSFTPEGIDPNRFKFGRIKE